MNTYTYQIIELITSNKDDQRPTDVMRVLTQITATDPEGRTETLNCMFDTPRSGDFVPFDQLTEEHVRAWVDAAQIQWADYKNQLTLQLEAAAGRPQYEPKPLPWLPTPEAVSASIQAQIEPGTTSGNTTTSFGLNPVFSNDYEEYIKALIFQVIEEINSSKV